jgi:hypothetical protein
MELEGLRARRYGLPLPRQLLPSPFVAGLSCAKTPFGGFQCNVTLLHPDRRYILIVRLALHQFFLLECYIAFP